MELSSVARRPCTVLSTLHKPVHEAASKLIEHVDRWNKLHLLRIVVCIF